MPLNRLKANDERSESEATRRRWARYPAESVATHVKTGTMEFDAVTVDESIGGLGFETPEAVAIVPGDIVELDRHGVCLRGQIAAVFPNLDGGCRISISWEEKDPLPSTSDRLPFFSYGSMVVVCTARSVTNSADRQRQCIQLWDGGVFEVASDQLKFRTKRARCTELQAMGPAREVLAKLYGIEPGRGGQALVDRILEFEFGT